MHLNTTPHLHHGQRHVDEDLKEGNTHGVVLGPRLVPVRGVPVIND